MKHSYQTRRLLALQDMRHDGQNVVIGDDVFATEIDARYLIRSGHARDPSVALPPSAAAPNAAAIAPPRRGPGRPPKTSIAARTPQPETTTTPATSTPGGEDSEAGDGGEPNSDVVTGTGDADGDGESGDQKSGDQTAV